MALAISTIWEVAASGADGNAGSDSNAGGFDPGTGAGNYATDWTADAGTGNTATPVISSATYNFVAADLNAWALAKGGGGWTLPNVQYAGQATTPGGVAAKITSIASNKATVDAAIGHAVCQATGGPFAVNDTAGVSTQATPTAGSGTLDYSMTGTPIASAADLASTTATAANPAVTSASRSFTQKDIGNTLVISAGTNWTPGVYVISATTAGAATLDRACGSAASVTAGTFREGGCLASPGRAGTVHVGSNLIYLRSATYTVTSASVNVNGGCVSLQPSSGGAGGAQVTALVGYSSYRTDAPAGTGRPTITADGIITSFNLVTLQSGMCAVYYCILNGNGRATSRGVQSSGWAYFCSGKNFTNGAFANVNGAFYCDATGCIGFAGFYQCSMCLYCVATGNTSACVGFFGPGNFYNCIAANNTTGNGHGFQLQNGDCTCKNCTAYGNSGHGFYFSISTTQFFRCFNCIAYANTQDGFHNDGLYAWNITVACAAGGNAVNYRNVTASALFRCLTLAGDPFVSAGTGNFGLNNTAGAGAACRGAGIIGAFPGLPNSSTFDDLGVAQHQDGGGGGGGGVNRSILPSGVSALG
jgi:hypothetical protein